MLLNQLAFKCISPVECGDTELLRGKFQTLLVNVLDPILKPKLPFHQSVTKLLDPLKTEPFLAHLLARVEETDYCNSGSIMESILTDIRDNRIGKYKGTYLINKTDVYIRNA